jgi:hypothetical protein
MEQSNELKAFVQDWIEKAHFDPANIAKFWSQQPGSLCIFTAPHEWLPGYQAILDYYQATLPADSAIQIRIRDLVAYREGAVGWIAGHPEFILPDGKEIAVRITAVLHQEEGEWKFVQYHVSAGVDDKDLFD